jgi:hypothetical protein
VELCRRHSNRPDLLGPLINVMRKIKNGTPDDEPDLEYVDGNTATNSKRAVDRLTDGDLTALLDAYRDGSTAATLAARYSVSPSTIKRLLREHGVRKRG